MSAVPLFQCGVLFALKPEHMLWSTVCTVLYCYKWVHACTRLTSGTADVAQVTVDAREGISTGISAEDRARTLRLLADPTASPVDFRRPGHINPLRFAQLQWCHLTRASHRQRQSYGLRRLTDAREG